MARKKGFRCSVLIWLWGMALLSASGLRAASDSPSSLDLMPWPESVIRNNEKFRLDEGFSLWVSHWNGPRLRQYAQRISQRLAKRTGIFFIEPEIRSGAGDRAASMEISCEREERVALGMDESYKLEVTPDRVTLSAKGDIGVMRGLETFLQLLSTDSEGYYFPGVAIEDRPRFAWRGLLLDVCRHFMPMDVILRTLDGMAMVKMNVFHWHLTENQGFRVECLAFPRLHQMGSDGLYYTQAQVREVIRHAEMRGIRVIPEFDIPGHSTAWFVGYPELASGPGPYAIERGYGVFDPAFNPARKATYRFFDRFFAEMARLFPDEYMHIGGDEVNGNEWNENAEIKAFKKKKRLEENRDLQNYFNKKIQQILRRHGKKIVGWDEIYLPGLDRGAIIHSWRGRESLEASARNGYRTLLSNGYYIDLMQSTAFHYQNDPLPEGTSLTSAEQANVLGGEATMWSELVSEETVDSRIWPRTVAIAERLWSPGTVRDVDDMFRRLDAASRWLEEAGSTHFKNREMLLRRLAGGVDAHALRFLLGFVEPVKEYERHNKKTYTFFSPLSRLVDAATVDPAPTREFEKKIALFLENRDEVVFKGIAAVFVAWEANHERLLALVQSCPTVGEALPLSLDLASLGSIGKAAAAYIFNKQKAPDAWLEEARKIVMEAAKPKAELELRTAAAVLKLLDAIVPLSRKEKEE